MVLRMKNFNTLEIHSKIRLLGHVWQSIWVHKTFKIEIQKGGPNNSDFLKNCFRPEIRSTLFNLPIFQKSDKSTPESCRMHWNLMKDKDFGSIKTSRLKCRRGDQIIQTFRRIGSPQKLRLPSLICKNFRTLRKVLLNQAERIEI